MYDDDPLTDDELLVELAAALQAQREVPGDLIDAGKAIFTFATIDAELAELEHALLTYDSLMDDAALQGSDEGLLMVTRSEPATLRALTYAAQDVSVELEVTSDAVLGQLVPPQRATITVVTQDKTSFEVPVDDVGWFTLRPVPAERFRLTFRTEEGRSIVTGWISL